MWQMYHHSVTGFIHNSVLGRLFVSVGIWGGKKDGMWCAQERRRMERDKVSCELWYNLDMFQQLRRTYFTLEHLALWRPVCWCKTIPLPTSMRTSYVPVCMPGERRILKMIPVAHKLIFPEWERRRHLAAWLSVCCHVLDWDVNHFWCRGSLSPLTVSGALSSYSLFLGFQKQ